MRLPSLQRVYVILCSLNDTADIETEVRYANLFVFLSKSRDAFKVVAGGVLSRLAKTSKSG